MQTKRIDYQKYLKSDYWQEIRKQVYERDGHRCRLCDSEEDLNVHHRTYKFLENEKLDELITLCKHCHNLFHKANSQHNYKTYIKHIEWEERRKQEEKETIDIWFFLSDNRDKFDEVKTKLINEKYIKCSEFHKIIKKLNQPRFDNILFINICLEYINGIAISSYYHSDAKVVLGLPKRSCDLIIDKDVFNTYSTWFNRFYYGKL